MSICEVELMSWIRTYVIHNASEVNVRVGMRDLPERTWVRVDRSHSSASSQQYLQWPDVSQLGCTCVLPPRSQLRLITGYLWLWIARYRDRATSHRRRCQAELFGGMQAIPELSRLLHARSQM